MSDGLDSFFSALSGEGTKPEVKDSDKNDKPSVNGGQGGEPDKKTLEELAQLKAELRTFEDYKPIIDAMRRDPNLINHIDSYFNGDVGQEMKSGMDLPEDFEFDFNEAVKNPDSDSAKLLMSFIDSRAEQIANAKAQALQQEQLLEKSKNQLMNEYGISEDDWKDFMDYTRRQKFEMKDIFFLYMRDRGMLNTENKKLKAKADTMQKNRQLAFTNVQNTYEPDDNESEQDVFEKEFIGALKQAANGGGFL